MNVCWYTQNSQATGSIRNLNTTPQAGLVFPDMDNGGVLYIIGKTEILAS